jgi:uncharacterized membrane protein
MTFEKFVARVFAIIAAIVVYCISQEAINGGYGQVVSGIEALVVCLIVVTILDYVALD